MSYKKGYNRRVFIIAMTLLCSCSLNCDSQRSEAKGSAEISLSENYSSEPSKNGWAQWRGPNRNGVSNETGILKSWPEAGPKTVWRKTIGDGYSAISIDGDRLYTAYTSGRDEVLFCLNASTGEEIWQFTLNENYTEQYGNGPRSTPAIDGKYVYAMGSLGVLFALDKTDGRKNWEVNIHSKFGDANGDYDRGYACSPLIEGDLLIMNGARQRGTTIVAFNKNSGKVVWTYKNGNNSYSSQVVWEIEGQKQVVSFVGYGIVGLSLETGEELWKYRWETSYGLNIAMPLFFSPNYVFLSSGYDTGAAMLQIQKNGNGWTPELVWTNRLFRNHFGSSISQKGYIYGFDNNVLKCISAKTGEEQWKARGYNKGSLIFADGALIILGENGNLGLVEATPAEFKELASAQILNGKCWTAPTLANGKLYLRNQTEMVCLELASGLKR